jgi:hypothetical protein
LSVSAIIVTTLHRNHFWRRQKPAFCDYLRLLAKDRPINKGRPRSGGVPRWRRRGTPPKQFSLKPQKLLKDADGDFSAAID